MPPGNLSLPNLKFLTSRQALEDAAMLIAAVNEEYGLSSPHWLAIGGSYSGALSAWFRTQYPNVVTLGALSSSGVVNAILDYTEFDTQVATATDGDCAAILRAMTAAFETLVNRCAWGRGMGWGRMKVAGGGWDFRGAQSVRG